MRGKWGNGNGKEKDEYELKQKMREKGKEAGGDIVNTPMMIKATKIFHEKHDDLGRRAKEEHEKVRQKIFSIKDKGQWNISKKKI